MPSTVILKRSHPQREAVESFIREIFNDHFGAKLWSFPETLIARIRPDGQIICAAGLRFKSDGFFSEGYLDEPAQEAISRIAQYRVSRDAIFEVSTLVSRDARQTGAFIGTIVKYGQDQGFSWSFYTLTRRLARMLVHIGIASSFLTRADRTRIPDHQQWGSYYDNDPCVFACSNPGLSLSITSKQGHSAHAISF